MHLIQKSPCSDASSKGKRNLKYLIITFRTPQFDPNVIEAHYAFLADLKSRGQLELAGPFTDQSGGAYLITADTLAEAECIAFNDPVHTSQSSQVKVYEWNAK